MDICGICLGAEVRSKEVDLVVLTMDVRSGWEITGLVARGLLLS